MRRGARNGVSSMYRIGIDLGGTHIAAGIVDDANRIIAEKSIPTVAQNGAAALLDDIAACVKDAVASGGLTMADCAGVGIGVPGTCDTECSVVRYAHNIGWDGGWVFRSASPTTRTAPPWARWSLALQRAATVR